MADFEKNQKTVGFTVTTAKEVNRIAQGKGPQNRLRNTTFYKKVEEMLSRLQKDPELRVVGGLNDRELAELPLQDPMQALKVILDRDFGGTLHVGVQTETYRDTNGKKKRQIRHIWVAGKNHVHA